MPDGLIMQVEPLTLESLCDGKVAKAVAKALASVAEAFEDLELQEGRTKLGAKIVVEIGLNYSVDSGGVTVGAAVKVDLPQPRAVGGVAMLRGGKFLVEPEGVQEQMFAKSGARA